MPATDVIGVTLTDYKGRGGTMPIHIISGTYTMAELEAWVSNSLCEYLEEVSGCAVTAITLTTSLAVPPTARTVAQLGTDWERGVNLGFDVEDSDYRHTIRVPGLASGIGDGESVDTGQGDVALLCGAIALPDAGVDSVVPCSKEGNDLLSAYETALITFYKSKRR